MSSENISNAPSLDTPILFLVFNRLDVTKQVFESIKKARPTKLYIACDGPRESKEEESRKVDALRTYLLESIDWDCSLQTLFRERNLGCKKAVSGAIDWFFANEEQGIILEDDCLPSQSFFQFCEEMLEKYKSDLRVWHVAGNNFHFDWIRDPDNSYYFSYYGSIWGWATWRSRWKHYRVEMDGYSELKDKGYLIDLFGNKKEANFRIDSFERIVKGMNTWDFQWVYTRLTNSGLSIVPEKNLVKNLGFGDDATHTFTKNDKRANMPYFDISFPLKHPKFIMRDKVSDDKFFKSFVYSYRYIIKKLIRR